MNVVEESFSARMMRRFREDCTSIVKRLIGIWTSSELHRQIWGIWKENINVYRCKLTILLLEDHQRVSTSDWLARHGFARSFGWLICKRTKVVFNLWSAYSIPPMDLASAWYSHPHSTKHWRDWRARSSDLAWSHHARHRIAEQFDRCGSSHEDADHHFASCS